MHTRPQTWFEGTGDANHSVITHLQQELQVQRGVDAPAIICLSTAPDVYGDSGCASLCLTHEGGVQCQRHCKACAVTMASSGPWWQVAGFTRRHYSCTCHRPLLACTCQYKQYEDGFTASNVFASDFQAL